MNNRPDDSRGGIKLPNFHGLIGGYTDYIARLRGENNEIILSQNRRYTRIIFRSNLENLHLIVGLEDVNTPVGAGNIKK